MPFGICLPFWFCNQSGNEPPFGPETGILPCAIASKDQTNASQTSSHISSVMMVLGMANRSSWLLSTGREVQMLLIERTMSPSISVWGAASPCKAKGMGPLCFQFPTLFMYSLLIFSLGFSKLCVAQKLETFSVPSVATKAWSSSVGIQRCGRKSGISASSFTLSPPPFFLQTFVRSMKGSGMVKFLKNFLTKSLWALPWALSGCSPDAPSWAKAVTSALWQPVSLLACAISCTSTALKEPKDHFLSKRRHSGDSGSSSLLGFSSGLFLLLFILSLQQAAAHVGGKAVPWSCWTIRLPSPFYSFLLEPKKKKTRAFQPWQLKQWAFQPWKFTVVELQVSCDCINQGLSNPENSL